MSRTTRTLMAGIAAAIAVSAASVDTGVAASASTATPQTATAVRLVTQQGLAIGMASNVLQSQLELLLSSESTGAVGKCYRLEGGTGSDKLAKQSMPSTTKTLVTNTLYYDARCKTPYITQTGTAVRGSDGTTVAATAKYSSPTGKQLGVLTTHAAELDTAAGEDLTGVGSFDPTGTQRPVALGLSCQIDANGSSDAPLPCQGAIAQNFPAFKQSLASVTPLILKDNAKTGALTFSGARNTRRTGRVGALAVTATPKHQVTISGKGTSAGSAATRGKAGSFSLFPATPTGWTVTDAADHLTFSITVISNSTRALRGTVESMAGAKLAAFSIDRSGTGTITYGTGREAIKAAVHSWILAG